MKGLAELRAHLTDPADSIGLWRSALAIVLVFVITTLFFVAADRGFAEWMPDGEIVVMALGFLILSRFYSQREVYQRKYGALAYRKAFARYGIPGLGIVMASIAHLGYIAGPGLPNIWWKPWLQGLGWLYVATAATLGLRAAMGIGIDNLAMLYVYYPEDTRLVETGLYSLIRHPIYGAALDVGWGLALIHANWYALLVALILPIFLFGWVRLKEEPDLLRRLPEYADYRRRVPAFGPRPRDWVRFIRYLIGRER